MIVSVKKTGFLIQELIYRLNMPERRSKPISLAPALQVGI